MGGTIKDIATYSNPITAQAKIGGKIFGGGGGSRTVTAETPEMSPQEKELLDLILGDVKRRQAFGRKNEQMLQDFVSKGVPGLSKKEQADLERITSTYITSRTEGLDKEAEQARSRLNAQFARQGISDSSIAAGGLGEVETNLARIRDQINREGELFRYGTERDLRQAALAERLQRIGVLQSQSNPAAAQAIFQNLSAQRSDEANRVLQAALFNAQNQGSRTTDLLGLAGLLGGGAIGALYGGVPGAAVGAGIGGTAGTTIGRQF